MHRALRPGGGPSALDALFRAGAPVDAVDEKRRTALYIAAATGNCEALAWLLQHGADVSVKAGDGRTALHAAAAGGHLYAVRLLVDAASEISPATAARLLMSTDSDGRSVAEVAAAARHLDVVRELLEAITGPCPKAAVGGTSSARGGAPYQEFVAHATYDNRKRQAPGVSLGEIAAVDVPSHRPQIEVLQPGSAALERLAQKRGYAMPVLHTPGSRGSVYFNGTQVRTP